MFSFNNIKNYIVLGIFAALALIGLLIGMNYSPGKWVCKDGLWVAEGNPNTKKPGLYCR
jgi:hypothetical protein